MMEARTREPTSSPELSAEDLDLMGDIAGAIDRRLAGRPRSRRDNVSFVINCRERLRERKWDARRQRRVCAALERRYLESGWAQASIYVMEHDHLRLRVTLRPPGPGRR
jgi:hypothetical protein